MRISDWSSDVCSSDLKMAVFVVVALEMIDVDHQRRNRSTLVQATMPFPHQTVVQRPAIGNAGQAVFGSQLGQLAIGHFKLRSAFGNARLESEIGRAHV